jgi:hypothetical protein
LLSNKAILFIRRAALLSKTAFYLNLSEKAGYMGGIQKEKYG